MKNFVLAISVIMFFTQNVKGQNQVTHVAVAAKVVREIKSKYNIKSCEELKKDIQAGRIPESMYHYAVQCTKPKYSSVKLKPGGYFKNTKILLENGKIYNFHSDDIKANQLVIRNKNHKYVYDHYLETKTLTYNDTQGYMMMAVNPGLRDNTKTSYRVEVRVYNVDNPINPELPLNNSRYDYDKIWNAAKFWKEIEDKKYDTIIYNWKFKNGKEITNPLINVKKSDLVHITAKGSLTIDSLNVKINPMGLAFSDELTRKNQKPHSISNRYFYGGVLYHTTKKNKIVSPTGGVSKNLTSRFLARNSGELDLYINSKKNNQLYGEFTVEVKILRRLTAQYESSNYFRLDNKQVEIPYDSLISNPYLRVKATNHFKINRRNIVKHKIYGDIPIHGNNKIPNFKKLDKFNYGALLCRLNYMQEWIEVQEDSFLSASEDGALEFMINAKDVENFTGKYVLDIELARRISGFPRPDLAIQPRISYKK